MSATGLSVFDKTIQTTNIWLDEVMADIGPDRHVAWHALGAVLRALRDRIPAELAAHLGTQLPLMVRGTYYDGYRPGERPRPIRDQHEFLGHVSQALANTRPVNVRDAVSSVFGVLSAHLPRGQCEKLRDALPADLKVLWHLDEPGTTSRKEKARLGRAAEKAFKARAYRARHPEAIGNGNGRSRSTEERAVRVSDAMSRRVRLINSGQTIQEAARMMRDLDIGVLPVAEGDRLVGMITDRDIAVRALAADKPPSTPVREVMTKDVKYCFEDERTEHVADNMGDLQVRRLPVVNRDKRLTGILSLGDIALKQGAESANEALGHISQPGGSHCQARPHAMANPEA